MNNDEYLPSYEEFMTETHRPQVSVSNDSLAYSTILNLNLSNNNSYALYQLVLKYDRDSRALERALPSQPFIHTSRTLFHYSNRVQKRFITHLYQMLNIMQTLTRVNHELASSWSMSANFSFTHYLPYDKCLLNLEKRESLANQQEDEHMRRHQHKICAFLRQILEATQNAHQTRTIDSITRLFLTYINCSAYRNEQAIALGYRKYNRYLKKECPSPITTEININFIVNYGRDDMYFQCGITENI